MSSCIILNPQAGSAGDLETVRACLQGRLPDATIRETEQPGDARKLTREALDDGCDLIVAVGGDGTINEVVNGLAPHFGRARLGVVPLGTGNDFARTINVPHEVEAACDVLLADRRQQIDVVRVTSDDLRYFINVSAGGFTGLVDEKLTDEMKRAWGPLAYLRSAAEALPDLTDYHTSITFDDEPPIEISAYNIVIANACYAGGGIPVAPHALIDDGLLDVLVVPVAPLPSIAVLAAQIMLGQHLDNDLVIVRRVSRVRVDSRPGMWFNTDGELVGNEPATFEVEPQAIEVIVGPANDS
jgi:diacylglycerol kinase (ATP)